ncbi:hypothetical protein HK102_002543, partial [Quaeritorhiza haematococci]
MPSTERLQYAGATRDEWVTIHGSALVCIFISWLGAAFVFTKTFLIWREDRRNGQRSRLRPRHFLAVSLSIADFLFNVPHFADHMYSLVHGYVLPDLLGCQIKGFLTGFGLQSIQSWAMVIAAYTASLILFRYEIPLGRYCWRAHLVGWSIPLIYCLIPISQYGAEAGDWYCYFSGRETNLYFKALGIFTGYFFCSMCYVAIIAKVVGHALYMRRFPAMSSIRSENSIGKSSSHLSSQNTLTVSTPISPTSPSSLGGRQLTGKDSARFHPEQLFFKAGFQLFVTLMVYIFTWLGTVTAATMFFSTGYVPPVVLLWDVITANLGGFTNALAYAYMMSKLPKADGPLSPR